MAMTKVSKKGLIISLFALMVALVVTTTSTYAWFAMNESVTATGMTVTAKTDNAFLRIGVGDTAFQDSDANTTANANFNDITLRPVHPTGTITSANVETVGSWGTATSSNPNDANASAEVTALTTQTLLGNGNYVMKQTFRVGIVPNSGAVANNLKLQTVTLPANTGISVVVVCGDNAYTHTTSVAGTGTQVLATAANVTEAGVLVNVYIYIDGANTNVKTANATTLTGTVSLGFSIAA